MVHWNLFHNYRCHLDATDEELQTLLRNVHHKLLLNFQNAKGYNRLTQSYLRKPFTILELLLSHVLDNFKNIQTTSSYETYEQIETGLNVLLLLLCQKNGIEFQKQDFTQLETDFVNYLITNGNFDQIYAYLPNINNLYSIAERRNNFYPFGTIKSYTALSILLNVESSSNVHKDMNKHSNIEDFLALVKSISNDREIDDVTNATWKFANTILAIDQVDLGKANDDQLLEILSYLHHISQTYKLSELR